MRGVNRDDDDGTAGMGTVGRVIDITVMSICIKSLSSYTAVSGTR